MKKLLALISSAAMIFSAAPEAVFAEKTENIEDYLVYYAGFNETLTADKGGGVVVNGNVTVKDNAAYFPDSASAYLTLTDENGGDTLLTGKSEFTVSFMEKRTGGKWPIYMASDTTAQKYNTSENYIGLYDDDAFRLERYVGTRSATTSSTVSDNNYMSGVAEDWRMVTIALTDDSSALYVDGKCVGTAESESALSALFGKTSVVALGHAFWGSGESYGGYIDEFKIYSKAVTAEDAAIMAGVSIEKVMSEIELGNTENISEDIALPAQSYGAEITWTSSDESIVDSEGKVTRTLEPGEAVLTARVTYNGEERTKSFTVTVKPLPTAEDILAEIDIENPDRILDSIDLVSELDGAKVTWESSDTDVITDQPTVNGDYTIPAGYVTRDEAEDKKVTLTVTVEVDYDAPASKEIELTVPKVKAEEEKVAYLYAYFRGSVLGSEEHLQIHVATSEDGYTWTDLNGNWPILTSTMGTTGLRDPYIIRSRYGDKFYLLATDLNTLDGQGWGPWSLNGSKYLAVWESEDLVNWSEQRMVKFANDDMGCAWAPEATYDEETGEYLVYAAGKDLTMDDPIDTVYVSRTRDFRTFSEPEYFVRPFNADGSRAAAIDSSIIRADDGKYYHFYKKYNNEVVMMVSDHASGPYTEVDSFKHITGEGPAEYKVNGTDTYCLCVDNYTVYVPYLTNDIASGEFTKATADVTMPTGSKHGTFVPISQTEYDGLLEAYGPQKVDPDGSDPILSYDFESETEGLEGNAKIENDPEKGNVLTLDGTDGTYFKFPENTFHRRNTFTLSMDVKSNMTDGNYFTFAVGSDTDHYYYFKDADKSLKSAITIAGYSNEDTAQCDLEESSAGQWARIALVVEPTRISVYRNGALMGEKETNWTISHLGVDGLDAYLGKSFFEADSYFNGSFDNIKLYNRALTQEELVEDMNLTDEESVNGDAANTGLGAGVNVITSDITLSETGAYGSEISWETSNPEIVSLDGKVNRPSAEEGDKIVTLTATFKKGEADKTVTYTLVVKAQAEKWSSVADWSCKTFEPATGEVYINFDITPSEYTDGVMGICSSDVTPAAWGDYNISMRIQPNGQFQAHNGTDFQTSSVTYEPNKTYHVTVRAYTEKQTFSMYVTDPNGVTRTVADNFSYRNKTGSDLSKANFRGGNNIASGLFTVEGFAVDSYPVYVAYAAVDGTNAVVSCENFGVSENVNVFVVGYDSDGNVVSASHEVMSPFGAYSEISADVAEGCASIKIFAWENGTLKPLSAAIER